MNFVSSEVQGQYNVGGVGVNRRPIAIVKNLIIIKKGQGIPHLEHEGNDNR
jgi:hypothetical protein